MTNPIDKHAKTLATSWTFIIVVAAIVGGVGGVALQSGSDSGPENSVAVVNIESAITGGTGDAVAKELRSIRGNDSIDAVVLRVSSPGGAVSGSEVQYRAVKRLAQEKPVVTSVRGPAASGGYYTIAPTDKIYVTPSSLVGSVGVISSVSENNGVPSRWKSAPDKGTTGPADKARARAATFRQSFLDVVMNERGDDLTVDRETIGRAQIYAGNKAVEIGLADEIGGLDAAIADAADRASVQNYGVVYRSPGGLGGLLSIIGGNSDTGAANAVSTSEFCTNEYLAYAPQAGPDLEVIQNASC
ncbi:S49 family peptidase [Halobacterium salinarum]|uniref:S49 family peptidase n=1 Tax=Halobacterium TaxID=2239 RepID=UPI001962FA4A|nr:MULTISPECIES: S49 family peptidase [Halobacterium]MCF2165690.1 S49 family peptidase [Halobacterium salinarum]MCF2166560.1 S49 family peptidase [Halobacterium salinarum]MCF2238353.1 S49 family peptidase [Halobacterium salinarum]MDL0139464.1 S49 family peptidase [Halobacterium salinarum]QRY23174.1 S49 family peptidase [Halobacterium sp. GSL-19]